MNPQFRRGDTLLIVPCSVQELQAGHVVLYRNPHGTPVVHRVVAITPNGVYTKGDNNPNVDERVLAPEDILGRVAAIERQGRTLPVPRKVPAALYLLKAQYWLRQAIAYLVQPIFRRLVAAAIFQGSLSAWKAPRLIYFSRAAGPEWQLWWGSLLLGRKKPRASQWEIRRLFRLFVDEADLPLESPALGKDAETLRAARPPRPDPPLPLVHKNIDTEIRFRL